MLHARPRTRKGARRLARRAVIAFVPAALLGACRGDAAAPDVPTISKEAFVDTYVQLRQAVVGVDSAGLDSVRAAILKDHGVTQQDLLTFADVHGRDVGFMRDVWDEVESRLDASHPDSLDAR